MIKVMISKSDKIKNVHTKTHMCRCNKRIKYMCMYLLYIHIYIFIYSMNNKFG